jgi:hypothetical protein
LDQTELTLKLKDIEQKNNNLINQQNKMLEDLEKQRKTNNIFSKTLEEL